MERLTGRARRGEIVEAGAGLGVMLARGIQEFRRSLAGKTRQQCRDRLAHVADQTEFDRHAAPQRRRIAIDLRHLGAIGIEIAVGKVGAQHQERVALLHRMIAR